MIIIMDANNCDNDNDDSDNHGTYDNNTLLWVLPSFRTLSPNTKSVSDIQ
jgi:hypothetical protein